MASYQTPQDEGYSEDPLTMQVSGTGRRALMESALQAWLAEQSVKERARFTLALMNGLPTSEVSKIVDAQRPRLYINFFDRLPPEVCLKVLGYLDPLALIRTAQASRDWMSLSMDCKLWEHLYYLEGWRVMQSELDQFERELSKLQPARVRPSFDLGDEQAHKKRATPRLVAASIHSNEDAEMPDVDAGPTPNPESLFGRSNTGMSIGKATMDESQNQQSELGERLVEDKNHTTRRSAPTSIQDATNRRTSTWSSRSGGGFDLCFLSSLTVRDRRTDSQRLNWQYLYAQRRRLEANWEHEKYVNFQLPHPDHLEEMHEECIYTIQHSGKYLVSGSRDRTLRIWDLDTRRLVRDPLRGHKGSVLCLQFDADPAEDLIVSGSSDSTVILWRFSTGQLIQSLKNAHRESVLNVRFDHRILVTCSKDKTIKIFNRRPLHPGDLGYPDVSHGVRTIPTILNNYGFNPSPLADLPVKQPYSMIGCLDGHGAAVNAVQIFENEIVSASGDRHVKVWDWPLQTCTRTLVGHQKGIACVQYDGRRIVSGSSDNEVKVFDRETGLEVASLRAHTNLVRTVQAGFGDLPYSAEEDRADARHVDHEYFKAVDSGALPRFSRRRRSRNAGSRKPEDIMAYGAKLPPGGGGGRYGRIVSGSYDETIIIWRRDKEGVWKAQHTLRQEDAARAASREFRHNPAQRGDSGASSDGQDGMLQPGSQGYFHNLITQIVPHGPHALRQALVQYPQLIQYPQLQLAISAEATPAIRNSLRAVVATALARQQILLAQQLHAAGQPHGPIHMGGTNPAHPLAVLSPAGPSNASIVSTGHQAPQQNTVPSPGVFSTLPTPSGSVDVAAAPASAPAPAPAPPAPAPHAQLHPHLVPASMARVFKLQFDARRIICCSQTAIIVGWDFANDDEKIIEASRFFAPIE